MLTRCRECFGPQIEPYFKAPVFLKFERDGNGCISANQFLNYLNLRTTMHQNVSRGVRGVLALGGRGRRWPHRIGKYRNTPGLR